MCELEGGKDGRTGRENQVPPSIITINSYYRTLISVGGYFESFSRGSEVLLKLNSFFDNP